MRAHGRTKLVPADRAFKKRPFHDPQSLLFMILKDSNRRDDRINRHRRPIDRTPATYDMTEPPTAHVRTRARISFRKISSTFPSKVC